MTAYYNEHDPGAAAWLRELIREGHIAPGVVDERDIQQLTGDDLAGFTQIHLFAGIGGWSLALRLAGWPDDRPVWTGSCPCQPFSAAGKRKGTADARHLWPDMRRLIAECRPPVVFGEQVASKDGRDWLAGVRADLETLDFAVGAADLCAAGAGSEGEGWFVRGDRVARERIVIGGPHIRQRLWWVADADGGEPWNKDVQPSGEHGFEPADGGASGGMANADGRGCGSARKRGGLAQVHRATAVEWGEAAQSGSHGGGDCGLVNADLPGPQRRGLRSGKEPDRLAPWSSGFDVVACADGKSRRFEPGSFPLAHGVSGRVGKLRGYGNAIIPQVAAAFVAAYLEAVEGGAA